MKNLILLNAKTSPDQRWIPPGSFAFLRDQPLLPAQATEAGRLASALPLALVRDADQSSGWNLMVVCGPASDANALVSSEGKWLARVLPDAARYLPFRLQVLGPGKALAGIDVRYAGGVLPQGNEGVPIHGEDGRLHPAARQRVDYLTQHQPHIQRTQNMLSALVKADILKPWPEQLIKAGNITLQGLHTIDEKALHALDDDAYLALRKTGALTLAYSCLLSLYQVRAIAQGPTDAKPGELTSIQGKGELDLEFLNDSDTIKFGPLQ